jgi:o-succinylbenzoate synthase
MMPRALVVREHRVRRYRIPYRRPLVTAHGVFPYREGAILELVSGDGLAGVGEIAPLPESGHTLDDALATIERTLPHDGGDLSGLLASLTETAATRSGLASMPAAWFGLETAAFDLYGKLVRRPVSECFERPRNQARPTVALNAIITAGSDALATEEARRAVMAGFRCIKLKVGTAGSPEREVRRIGAVREAIGPQVHLRIDANEAWSFDEALALLTRVADLGIQYCEQPLHRADIEGLRALRLSSPIPIAADESVATRDAWMRTLQAQAADVVVLKLQSLMGLRGARRAIRACASRGNPPVACVITSSMETGIGVSAALHVAAASPTVTLECGLATLDLLEDDLIAAAPRIVRGSMQVPREPGLGVDLDRTALARYAA